MRGDHPHSPTSRILPICKAGGNSIFQANWHCVVSAFVFTQRTIPNTLCSTLYGTLRKYVPKRFKPCLLPIALAVKPDVMVKHTATTKTSSAALENRRDQRTMRIMTS